VDLETFRWLLTDDGQHLLASAVAIHHAQADDPVAASSALRAQVPGATPAQAAAAMTQATLRARAVDKFGADAERMYFTSDGLEQSTRPRVADHRAARLVAAEVASVVDLGCGIGGDLVALARAGLTGVGVDLDPVRVAVAEANLAALGLAGAVGVADATTLDLTPFGAAFADPARRSGRGRVMDAESWTPPWPFVEQLLDRPGARAVVKVAPGISHALVPDGVEAEWVSVAGEVKEAALWSAALATVRRRATVIGPANSPGLATLTEEDDPYEGQRRPVREVGEFLYEPDGAVIRARLVTAVAAGVQGGLLDAHIAYVTSDMGFRSPFARAYRVVEELPFREKQLKAALRARDIGVLSIKKRGVGVDPASLRRRLALSGSSSATLVLTRRAGSGIALLVEPV
jgi:SAM-dependent methyltransferase